MCVECALTVLKRNPQLYVEEIFYIRKALKQRISEKIIVKILWFEMFFVPLMKPVFDCKDNQFR